MKKIITTIFISLTLGINAQVKDVFDIARNGTLKEMKLAFKKNPNSINELDKNRSSTLILACYKGNTDVAKFLINKVKDLNYSSAMGTALMAAAYKNQLEFIKLLIDKKANINGVDGNGTTALMLAVQMKSLEVVRLLLENKADKSIKNNEGKTAFEYAVFGGEQKIIDALK